MAVHESRLASSDLWVRESVQVCLAGGSTMQRLLEASVVERTLQATVALLALTPIVTYVLWIADGCEAFVPFISDMDLPPRSGFTFTLGYALSGILLATTGVQLGVLRERWMSSAGMSQSWVNLNRFSVLAAVAAGISLFWISFTPWDEHLGLHIVQANVIFSGSVIWAFCVTLATWKMSQEEGGFSDVLAPRAAFSMLAVVGLLGMVERVFRYTGLSTDLYALEERLQLLDEACVSLNEPLLSQAAAFEWLLAASMVLIIATFLPEVRLLTGAHEEEE
ncbi:MAG: hypothetical protein CMB39_04165 [Euryarchaeota archaeon]|nr:hypothetical protein [Euryarchaeota archaeon]